MAGGKVKYRHLSRTSSHRQALLRNLVTSLIKHETIHTTWPKAKEAQRVAEKLISLGKRNTVAARRVAQGILYTPHDLLPKLFGEIRERYQHRPGGYTRVLRTEPKDSYDQAPSAVLELVDGRRDMRFAMTAATVARDRAAGREHTDITLLNVAKVTRFRKEGQAELDGMVERIRQRFGSLSVEGDSGAERLSRGPPRRKDGEADGAKRSRKEGGITSSDSDFPTLV